MIDKLELLLALAKERHFGRAAEACGVTQPTMSTSLKQLEEILGVMLVQRGSRFQGFTPEGERTLDWARRIVGDARAMKQEINSLKDKLSGDNTAKTAHPAPTRTETDRRGNSTIVYSTRTEDDHQHHNEADTDGLTTLDTLADNQRETTHARHDLEAEAEAQNNADGGAEFGRHELRDDR